jgi:hypothetical protein
MQGPEQVRVSLTVNGARMELGSTAALWQPNEEHLQLAVLDGMVTLEDGTTIERGFTADVLLDEDGQAAGDWTEPRPLTVFEVALLLPLEDFSNVMLNYPINVPEEGEPSPTPPVTSTPIPVVQPTRPAPRPTLTPTPVPPTFTPAPVVSFYADTQTVGVGQCATLYWSTQNIDSVYFQGQPTVGESSQQVCPRITETYTLLVIFRDGTQQTYSLTIQVQGETSEPGPGATCGNQICEPGEHMLNCTVDCREPVCGNLVCEPYEDACTCGGDCSGECPG